MKTEVVCYSGYKGGERPVRFRLSGQDFVARKGQCLFFQSAAKWGGHSSMPRKVKICIGSAPREIDTMLIQHAGQQMGTSPGVGHRLGQPATTPM
ncbi:MAG: hypothetical protein NTW28_05080 [Candidatus Solibacter sp.]|nr:hypothetical protein [Candidatus Solibacter sp.]